MSQSVLWGQSCTIGYIFDTLLARPQLNGRKISVRYLQTLLHGTWCYAVNWFNSHRRLQILRLKKLLHDYLHTFMVLVCSTSIPCLEYTKRHNSTSITCNFVFNIFTLGHMITWNHTCESCRIFCNFVFFIGFLFFCFFVSFSIFNRKVYDYFHLSRCLGEKLLKIIILVSWKT